MKQIKLYIIIVSILAVGFLYCKQSRKQLTHNMDKNIVFSGVDATGTSVRITQYPANIVSLAPSNTEILFDIGLGASITGRTRFCNYPPEVESIPIVGGFVDINVERIVALQPDLVLAIRGNPQKSITELRRLAIKVFALDPKDITDVVRTIKDIGNITGKKENAEILADNLARRIEVVSELVKTIPVELRPKVFYGDWKSPITAAGINNPIDSLITMAGGINIATDSGVSWPHYSFERILAHNPDIILSGFKNKEDLVKDQDLLLEEIRNDMLWSKIKAVQTNRIYFIDEDIVMRPGPRMVDALELLARYFHPDKFNVRAKESSRVLSH
ncbi:MAG: hypothetical protein A2161_21660 [Candidatus Schekmanbacteria bacterium RBG_13_48_7]|uniref:Fe/B12 periplasmic-binding domain-containing protein n=1 Tax=Candidatus Schekmanbacteria bacterium RBG_13_48_7 TaxID=1817878 RepID=A0A1F7RMW2_9BACT|nr:MAG: hypothetical protein A2161_21660 [Candidatus Schekmanbacteria bacterium RBG_13_48_7]